MAGTLQLDFLQPQSNTGLYILSPTGSTMASVNTAGIYSATGSLLVANTGGGLTTSNLTASGTITGNTLTLTGNSLVVGSNTIIIPSTGGTAMVSGNMPAFSAYASTTQSSISSTTFTKILFDTELFDTNNNFASSRFTPTVAGYYQINSAVETNSTTAGVYAKIYIYKNGTVYKEGSLIAAQTQLFFATNVSGLVYCNGTTDYIEIYYIGYVAAGTLSTNALDSSRVWMDGVMVRSA